MMHQIVCGWTNWVSDVSEGNQTALGPKPQHGLHCLKKHTQLTNGPVLPWPCAVLRLNPLRKPLESQRSMVNQPR